MAIPVSQLPVRPNVQVRALGVVSYLNARPLHESLQGRDDVEVKPAVPSQLADMLAEDQCDVALLPIVDYWRRRDRLKPISDACIASDGETLTVRVFSRVPPDKVRRLHVDGDSHTSVVLAQLVWCELYGYRPELLPWDAKHPVSRLDDVDSVLLIGDKVVQRVPGGFGFEVDLGAAWKHLTGLPFVFAAWYGAADRDFRGLADLLQAARDAGVAEARRIALAGASQLGWPEDVAVKYLCTIMKYTLTDPMRAAMERFFDFAVGYGLLP